METILLSLILVIGIAVLFFQIKNKPKQDSNMSMSAYEQIDKRNVS